MNLSKTSKILLEFSPVIVFFFFYKFYGIKTATISIIITAVASNLINYFYNKHINILSLGTTALIVVLGSFTIWSNNPIFIKIKPTVVNLLFACILGFGLLKKQGYMKKILGAKISMSDAAWIKISKRFAVFFVFLALLNEVVWRFCEESTWVNFKVFGTFIILCIFILAQMPFLNRHRLQ